MIKDTKVYSIHLAITTPVPTDRLYPYKTVSNHNQRYTTWILRIARIYDSSSENRGNIRRSQWVL